MELGEINGLPSPALPGAFAPGLSTATRPPIDDLSQVSIGGELSNGEAIPYLDFAVDFAHGKTGHLLHNYGAIRSLEWLLTLLHGRRVHSGQRLRADADHSGRRFRAPAVFACHFRGHQLPALEGVFRRFGPVQVGGAGGGQRPDSLAAAGAKPGGGDDAHLFTERFGKAGCDWLQEPASLARANIQHGRIEAALAAYHQALDRQPYNWILMNEVAMFLTFTLRNPAAGIAMAKAALDLNPSCSAELWNTLGDAYFEVGKMAEARNAAVTSPLCPAPMMMVS